MNEAEEKMPATPVDCPAGRVRGIAEGGVCIFRGIPYAKPPVGDLRWRPPERLSRWHGELEAFTFGPACMQSDPQLSKLYTLPAELPRSEDCLSLNIWAPSDGQGASVMVWIHGGSLMIGSSSEPMYDGAALASRGIVLVTINYRLGVFGWLAHPELGDENKGLSGNYGLLDQICALEWIQDNIAAFGGNPDDVTVAGESAGALSALYLMASPRAAGLFHKVIAQSPYMISTPALKEAVHGTPSAEEAGIAFTRDMKAFSIAELRCFDAESLVRGATRHGFAPFGCVDGEILPDQLVTIFGEGRQAAVSVLAGFNEGEIRSLRALAPPLPATPFEYEQAIRSGYGARSEDFLRLYPASDLEGSVLSATRDALYGWTTLRLARDQERAGQRCYVYLWDHGYPAADSQGLHAFHASEIPFLFGNLNGTGPHWPPIEKAADQMEMSSILGDYWTSFVQTGVPSSDAAPAWPSYSPNASFMRFADDAILETKPLPGVLEFHSETVAQRFAAGNIPWNWNVGLLSPQEFSVEEGVAFPRTQ